VNNELARAHYDRITAAWRLVMGEAFHYGVFLDDEAARPVEALQRAAIRLNERMLEAVLPLPPQPRVLDLGCGIGGPARWLSQAVEATVLGLSPSEVGIDLANRLSADDPRTSFEVGDAQHNGQPDDHYDLVWVMESSHLMPEKPRMIRDAYRALKPGGRFVLCDQFALDPFQLDELFAWRDDLNTLDRAFGRAKMQPPTYYAEEMTAAGLVEVVHEDLTEATRPSLAAWIANCDTHRAELETLIGAEAITDLQRACEVLAGFWGTRIGYGLLSGRKPA